MCQYDCDLEWPSPLPYKVWGVVQARYNNVNKQRDVHVKCGRPGSQVT